MISTNGVTACKQIKVNDEDDDLIGLDEELAYISNENLVEFYRKFKEFGSIETNNTHQVL